MLRCRRSGSWRVRTCRILPRPGGCIVYNVYLPNRKARTCFPASGCACKGAFKYLAGGMTRIFSRAINVQIISYFGDYFECSLACTKCTLACTKHAQVNHSACCTKLILYGFRCYHCISEVIDIDTHIDKLIV